MDKLKDIIRKKLKEVNATQAGGATAMPGQGEAYGSKNMLGKNKYYYKLGYKDVNEGPGADLGPGPDAGPEGVKDNAYVKQFKYKLVPKKIKGSGLEVKQLWEDEQTDVEKFQEERINEFDEIQDKLNVLISNAKNQTIEYYKANPGKFSIYKPTSMALEYIKKAQKLLSK
jgi:hypothetical protein